MKIAIVGSREFPRLDLVSDYVQALPTSTVVVSGGATGVDTVAENSARKKGLEVVIFRPEWKKYGRAAGFLRNYKVVEEAEKVIAFWDERSRGTQHVIAAARKKRKPLEVGVLRGNSIEWRLNWEYA